MSGAGADSVSTHVAAHIRRAIEHAGGWLSFERFMELALYAPGLGYYARDDRQFGMLPASGSDFVTAPELSPLFGRALARQIGQALDAAAADEMLEFGAGSGALAAQVLDALGARVSRYSIVDLSGSLAARQRATLQRFGSRVRWLDALPEAIRGVVIGNEVLDAMPVQLLAFDGECWRERGVVAAGDAFTWSDRATESTPPVDADFVPGTVVEVGRQARAFVKTVAERVQRGVAIFIDYGFPEREFYHPQRIGGTLTCHRGHRLDFDPLADIGLKDITAHVDFTAIALAAQDSGCDIVGYTSQARFLMNCGLLDDLEGAPPQSVAVAQKLVTEHEMGELFKVLAFAHGVTPPFDAIGFRRGDRRHRL